MLRITNPRSLITADYKSAVTGGSSPCRGVSHTPGYTHLSTWTLSGVCDTPLQSIWQNKNIQKTKSYGRKKEKCVEHCAQGDYRRGECRGGCIGNQCLYVGCFSWQLPCYAGFAIRRNSLFGFVIRIIYVGVADYKSARGCLRRIANHEWSEELRR